MGRLRKGPVRLNGGTTWYARLTVPPRLREVVGKTRLIRSLKTTNHGTALKVYGGVYAQMERELAELAGGGTFRDRIEASQEGLSREGYAPLTPIELTEIQVGQFNPENPVHTDIYAFHAEGKALPLTWDEALNSWVRVRNRENPRALAEGSVSRARKAVELFAPYASPSNITKLAVRKFIDDQEALTKPITVAGKLKLLSAIVQCCVEQDLLDNNVFKGVRYIASNESDRRACTDDEIRLLYQAGHPLFEHIVYGFRGGEMIWGRIDADDSVMIIKPVFQDGKEIWRPKTKSSERRCPLRSNFKRPDGNQKRWGRSLRKLITDPNVVMHSGRHTHIELSRRAGAESQIVAEYCGHGSDRGSTSQRGYGNFPDEVMFREISKVWKLIDHIVSANSF